MNAIGIMQGRLSLSGQRPQSFPLHTWRDEFTMAAGLGFDCIEWLIDLETLDRNPALCDTDAVQYVIDEAGVAVHSMCADCFIHHPFARNQDAVALLRRIVAAAGAIGGQIVCLPFLEGNAVAGGEDLVKVLQQCKDVIETARSRDVRIAIESDLAAEELREAIERADVDVCYDLGNAAASGRDLSRELFVLRDRIALVHVKDRRLHGSSVPLGQGDADFASAFTALLRTGYAGPLVLETPRGASPRDSAAANLEFVNRQVGAITAAA